MTGGIYKLNEEEAKKYGGNFALFQGIFCDFAIREMEEMIMFEMDDDYIKEVNANYWVEEEEMKTGVHPSQIIERIQKVLDKSGVKKKITFMDYSGFSGTRVGVFVDKEFYGVFDYIENVFESTSESRVNEK